MKKRLHLQFPWFRKKEQVPARKYFTRRGILRFLKRAGIGFLSLILLFFILNWIFPLPDKVEYSTIITDNKGEVINAFLTKDQKWRMKTELDEISPLLQKTIVAKEDRHFYSHPGVNLFAVIRAFFSSIFDMRRMSGDDHQKLLNENQSGRSITELLSFISSVGGIITGRTINKSAC